MIPKLIGVVTGVIGSIVNQEGFSQKDVISAALGLGLGFTVTIIFVLCSGSLVLVGLGCHMYLNSCVMQA